MKNERTLLRKVKARHKEELASLKHFMRELKHQCAACSTQREHSDPAMLKAKHDAQFHQTRIKAIGARLKALSTKTSH